MPTMSSMKAEAFLTPGLYFVGCPQRFRRSRPSCKVAHSPLSMRPISRKP